MRALILALLLIAGAAKAGDLPPRVAALLDGIGEGLSRNAIIPFVLDHQHPRMKAALAAHLGMDEATYDARVRAGYAHSLTVLRVIRSEVHRANRLEGDGWVLVPVSTSMEGKGAPPPTCGNWLVFRDGETWYVENLTNPVARRVFAREFPAFASIPMDEAPRC